MRARRTPTRLANLVGAPPVEVLAATAKHQVDEPAGGPFERGLRTGAAVAVVHEGWQWPRWLDRQLRAGHPAFVPLGDVPLVENVTARDWKAVGTASSGALALVDPRGLVEPVGAGWTIDWLIGAEDRWHRPARDAGVRQRMLDGAPVPETSCRVPGGDIIHRVYGVTLGGDIGDATVIEVENTTSVPVAVAFAVRPADLLGVGTITSIALDDTRVLIDGRPCLVFDRRPAHTAAGDSSHDSLQRVVANEADDQPFETRRDPLGLAQAAFILPVAHKTSVRVVILTAVDRRARPVLDAAIPAADAVARGWASHAERSARLELPDPRLIGLYEAAVRSLLLASGGGSLAAPIGRADRWSVADEARLVRSMQSVGLHDPAGAVLRRRGDEFELDGWFRREPPSLARNAAVFEAVGATWSLAHDRATVDAVLGPAVKSAHWSERYRARRSRSVTGADAYASHDSLIALATALRGVGQHEAAQDVGAFAARFVLDHDDRPNDAAVDVDGGALLVMTPRGIDVRASVDRATRWAAAGDERALPIIPWLVEVAGDRGRWPTFVHPRLGTGCAGSGDDPLVAAAVADLAVAFALRIEGRTLALLPLVTDSWIGHPIDVRDVPTPAGRCSFSVRWHGERPALLWELEGSVDDEHDDRPARITIPGLDPTFETTVRAGEALLAAPSRPVTAPVEPGASFG